MQLQLQPIQCHWLSLSGRGDEIQVLAAVAVVNVQSARPENSRELLFSALLGSAAGRWPLAAGNKQQQQNGTRGPLIVSPPLLSTTLRAIIAAPLGKSANYSPNSDSDSDSDSE